MHALMLTPSLNCAPPPVPVGDADKIRYRSITSYNHTTKEQPKDFDVMSIPYNFHLDRVNSDFIRYFLFLDLRNLSQEDKDYLVLLTETWLETAQGCYSIMESPMDGIKGPWVAQTSLQMKLGA